jgi:hypothetical protein
VFAIAAIAGSLAARHYWQSGLTLSHYDARSHLVVARRTIDSLTPSWRQLGAVWLPLPHLLNALPVQIDWNFRTGFSAVAISVLSLAWGLASLGQYLTRHTGSLVVGVIVPLAVLANPNVLYLQSTPLTEPLMFGLALVSLLAVDDWVGSPDTARAHRAGLCLAALMLTRYEGWLICAALVAVACLTQPAGRSLVRLFAYPAAAVAAFFALSYLSSGVLLVTSGFFTPDNPARHNVSLVLDQIWQATWLIAAPALIVGAGAGVAVCLWKWRSSSRRSLLPLCLLASAVLPFGAFYAGHPERVRYMVPLVLALAALSGMAFAVVPARVRGPAAALWLGVAMFMLPPFSTSAPLITEAQWETPFRDGRRNVSAYLQTHYDGTPILASMGSLAHYMQESTAIGLEIRNYVHEGNGDLWLDAYNAPRHHVRWVMVEEQAEGGDMIAVKLRSEPGYLDGFARVVEGGGLALYKRQ